MAAVSEAAAPTDGVIYNLNSPGIWPAGTALKTYAPNEYPLTSGYTMNGGSGTEYPRVIEYANRATCIDGIMVGLSDGKTFGLTSYTLSTGETVSYQLWYGRIINNSISANCHIKDATNFTGRVVLQRDVVLPKSNDYGQRFAIVAFRSGSGRAFTNEELAEIQSLIKVV